MDMSGQIHTSVPYSSVRFTKGWLGLKASVDVVEKTNVSCLCRKSVAHSFTDWTIPVSLQEVSMVRHGMDMNSIKFNWMEIKLSWEAYGRSADRKTPRLKWGPNVRVFTRSRHWSLSWARWIQSIPSGYVALTTKFSLLSLFWKK
jgi:hypothetical protein